MIIASPPWTRVVLAAAALLTSVAAGAAADPLKNNAEQLDKLRSRMQALRQSLEQDRGAQDQLRNELQASEQRLVNILADLKTLRRRIAEQTAQLRKTATERAENEAVLRRNRSILSRQIRAAYVIGQRGQTKLVLNQDRSQRLSRVMTYYDYLNRARASRIGAVLEQVKELETLVQKLKAETLALEATRNRQQGTLTALEAARAERGDMLKTIAARIKGGEGELQQLRSDERELVRLLEELRSVLADIPANLGSKPFAALKGRLPWPLKGRLLARFGNPKAGGQLKWNGLWIAGNEGDPVKAVARGRVAYVGWMHRYGLIVVLEHEGGYYSLYGHNQSVTLNVGDWAKPGDAIASVGATGGHEKPGLYFELRKGTDAINPRPWLRN
jgi:septal ring factor EnvC (AmiA/AmiB activator)